MNITSRELFITVVVAVLIVNNFIFQLSFIPKMTLRWPAEFRILPPGYRVLSLKDHLKGVRIAGYYTDSYDGQYWLNSDMVVGLQRSQYALSPTVLDIEHCFDHDYVVFECKKPGCFRQIMKQQGYETIDALNDYIILARRK